jgi:hypothetical protein
LFALRASSSALFAAALLLVGSAPGCAPAGEPPVLPPPPSADGGAEASLRTLAVLPDATARTLLLGESLSFSVRYAESDGRPVADAEVSFAMVGVAHDATLVESVARTDANGVARGTLRAGRIRAAFRVRASAMGAAAASFDVAIGDAGFGGLRAEVRYGGERALTTRSVALYAGVSCSDPLAGLAPDREQALVEVGDAVRFVALPAGISYAVVARGESPSGAVLTKGCADAPAVVSGGESSAVVTMADVPPDIEGRYDATLALRAPGAPLALGEAAASVVSASEATGGDATHLLDAVALDLADRDAEAAARFAIARVAQGLDTSLDDALRAADGGPTRALVALLAGTAEALGALRMSYEVTLDARGRAVADGIADVQLFAAAERPEGPLPLAFAEAPNVGFMSGYASIRGLLVVEGLRVDLPLGATIAATLDAVAQSRGMRGAEDFVAGLARCEAVATWAASTPGIAASCDAACARAACVGVSRTLVAELVAELAPLDRSRAEIALVGAVPVRDTDLDALVDGFGPERVGGTWRPAGGTEGDPVSADLAARRR